jgi:hypothetical protein
MKLHLDCDISLSKKLRAILGDTGSITLQTEGIVNGKGKARLILVSNNECEYHDLPEELKKETSIMLTPFGLSNVSAPTDADPQVAAIFATPPSGATPPPPPPPPPQSQTSQTSQTVTDLSGGNPTAHVEPRTPADKIAVTTAPEQNQISSAVKRPEEIETPAQFTQEFQDKSYAEYVHDYEELMQEVNLAKSKVIDIDPSQISDPRLRAIENEKKERLEAINKKAYIVTDSAAVSINDMEISLSANMPYDLSQISAKRIAMSNDLRELINLGYVKIITPDQVQEYVNKSMETKKIPQLEIFDNHEEAERNMEKTVTSDHTEDAEVIDMDSYADSKTEDEIMLNDLTKGMR